jgi:hypothetical protein
MKTAFLILAITTTLVGRIERVDTRRLTRIGRGTEQRYSEGQTVEHVQVEQSQFVLVSLYETRDRILRAIQNPTVVQLAKTKAHTM